MVLAESSLHIKHRLRNIHFFSNYTSIGGSEKDTTYLKFIFDMNEMKNSLVRRKKVMNAQKCIIIWVYAQYCILLILTPFNFVLMLEFSFEEIIG